MLALTLWQPWAWAIMYLPDDIAKPVENRDWKPPARVIGTRIALHGGLRWDADGAARIYAITGRAATTRRSVPLGATLPAAVPGILGTVRLVGVVEERRGRIELVAGDWGEVTRERCEPWFVGRYGWLLDQRRVLGPPIPCRGFQKLWAVPERQRRILAAAIDQGTIDAPATWGEAVELYLSHRREEGDRASSLTTLGYQLAAAGQTIGALDPLALTSDDGRRHRDERVAAGRKAATVRNELEAVSSVQRWFVQRGWIQRATWLDVTRPEGASSRHELRPDEVGRFVRAAERLAADPTLGGQHPERRPEDWQDWPAAVWLLLHGLRTQEVQHLLVGDIDLVTGHVTIADREGARTKSRSSERTTPILAARALECLRETFAGRDPDAPAFAVHSRGGAQQSRTAWFLYRCRITCEVAGVRRCTVHELRHTVATAAVVAGADMHSVQSLLGHADARTTARIYAHATSAERAAGAARAVSAYLDRVVEARPALKRVR